MLFVYIAVGVVCVSLVVVGGYYVKSHGDRRRKDRAVESICREMSGVLEENIPALESGNINWRRIGHGKDVVKLSRLIPGPSFDRDDDVRILRELEPDLVAKCEKHDRMIKRLRQSASELASAIQSKVRERYDGDRDPADGEPAVRNVPEDGWILILQGVVNNGNFDDGLKGNLGEYWEEHHEQYEEILQRYGANYAKTFENAKKELLEIEKDIDSSIEKLMRGGGRG
ncbi:MAG: hypothetical protein ACOCR1_05645 [Planctomycetota bacterium]